MQFILSFSYFLPPWWNLALAFYWEKVEAINLVFLNVDKKVGYDTRIKITLPGTVI
jgi:hypothetical protein